MDRKSTFRTVQWLEARRARHSFLEPFHFCPDRTISNFKPRPPRLITITSLQSANKENSTTQSFIKLHLLGKPLVNVPQDPILLCDHMIDALMKRVYIKFLLLRLIIIARSAVIFQIICYQALVPFKAVDKKRLVLDASSAVRLAAFLDDNGKSIRSRPRYSCYYNSRCCDRPNAPERDL